MTNVETQTSQRTVVAFISGLLIGGLLVWIFSATPDEKKQNEDVTKTDSAEKASTDSETAPKGEENTAASVGTNNSSRELSVADQKAGTMVTLGKVAYPNEGGWVVVRDAQGVLGAARFDVAAGLQPTTVELLRPTFAGNTYEVVFYTNEGTVGFNLAEDKLVDGVSAKFTAN